MSHNLSSFDLLGRSLFVFMSLFYTQSIFNLDTTTQISEIGERRNLNDLSIRFDLNFDKFQLIKLRSCALGCDRCAVYASQLEGLLI